jgi:hypothetical protein
MRLDQLADVLLQQRVGHAKAAARIEHLLGEKETVAQSRLQVAPVGFVNR